MNQQALLQRTIRVLIGRLPEVVMLVVLQAGLMLVLEQAVQADGGMAQPHIGQIPGWALFVLGFGCALMAVLWQMLYLGFLRTAALAGDAPHDPMTLLATGRAFFWRVLGVQFVLGVMMWLAAGVMVGVLAAILRYQQTQMLPQWMLEVVGIGAIALLIKPLLLIPAFILTMDVSATEGFGMMRRVRLRLLVRGYAVGLILIASAAVVSALAPHGGVLYYILSAVNYLIQSATILTLMLATVLFVAESQDNTQ